ncbi:coiled-coil domain-containing protein 15 isoform X7 [Mesocricetus auratus]|uniref:Coiled-coil domain-containing protein 15 isoform X7 n=1 Tax=Mesocricetus auratus TaxID=10036 RepID=A0ABM2W5U8_MESAU|nr:coiled-coil domain-containing protein 15 isoform X7 [Mesocricetus auratus]
MPRGMAPLKKPRNPTKLPLALNPTKSKDVLAVLAERNQTIVPVGAWVEPAPPNCSEIPAHTSAYIIEEEIKEQQRRKQESLKHFQRQVRRRVNQQVKLRKKQQLQKSCTVAEKEGSVAMQCSDLAHLTPKRTSVFSGNLNAAMGSCVLPSSQVLGGATEDGENQNQLFEQQAQALSQTMKQARHQLASFKTVSEKKTSVFLNGRRKSSPNQEKALLRKPPCITINKETREEPPSKIYEGPLTTVHYQNFMGNQDLGCGEITSIVTGEKERDLLVDYQQDLLSEDKEKALSKVQDMFLKQPSTFMKGERKAEELPLECQQYVPPQVQDRVFHRDQYRSCEQTSYDAVDERWRKELYPECYRCDLHEIQDSGSATKQSLHFRQQPCVNTAERWQEDLHLGGCERLPPRHQRGTCSRQRQVSEECQSRPSTEYQALLAFQSGVDQEEDKKERQKQYLRHRRLFMDIEREQVKEQNRQREQKKRIEKIKKRKEQQRYAEEQRLLRMHCHEEPYSEEKINDVLAQLQLEEIKGAKDKQHQREKEYVRYVEALRAQVQEKMKLYNITLPPLCCCGPNFWDAHPDTCANNCIFYKNYRAYNRALHSVINSSDISEGNATLRNAIRNFASVHRRTSKKSLQ